MSRNATSAEAKARTEAKTKSSFMLNELGCFYFDSIGWSEERKKVSRFYTAIFAINSLTDQFVNFLDLRQVLFRAD